MTDRIAILIGGFILVAILADLALNGGDILIFLLRKLSGLVEYLAFWR